VYLDGDPTKSALSVCVCLSVSGETRTQHRYSLVSTTRLAGNYNGNSLGHFAIKLQSHVAGKRRAIKPASHVSVSVSIAGAIWLYSCGECESEPDSKSAPFV